MFNSRLLFGVGMDIVRGLVANSRCQFLFGLYRQYMRLDIGILSVRGRPLVAGGCR